MVLTKNVVSVRDVNESRLRRVSKKILGLEKKISQREISPPEICARTDVGIEVSANKTRCLCSLPEVDTAASPADRHGLRRRCWCLITPSTPPHTSSVAVCLPDAFDLTAATSLPLR